MHHGTALFRPMGAFLGLLGLLALAGCAGFGPDARPPETPAKPLAATPPAQTLVQTLTYEQDHAREVFLAAYSGIARKYITPTLVARLAEEGLTGLAAIDPALVLNRTDDMMVMEYDGKTVFAALAPAPNNPKAWAGLTVTMITEGARVSKDLRQANAERIYEAVFDAALSELDIFSRYAGAEEALRNRAKRDGFGGIGIRFQVREGAAHITQIIPDTPAEKGGLRIGDRITQIDDFPAKGLPSRRISKLLRGPIHSEVVLRIWRDGEKTPQRHVLKRTHIVPVTVSARLDDNILFLRVQGFNRKTAKALVSELKRLDGPDPDAVSGIVLDLRGNPGGLLNQSIEVADLFLDQGQIMSTAGRHADSIHYFRADGSDRTRGLPLAILVDGGSASAAEVVAAALQDLGRGVVIGTTSYGKGTVQTVIRLPNDGEITLTWSKLIAPSGYAFHGRGVRPVVCTARGGNRETLIRTTLADGPAVAQNFSLWRTPGRGAAMGNAQGTGQKTEATAILKKLRATCPSLRLTTKSDTKYRAFPDEATARPFLEPLFPEADLEAAVARTILVDRALYAQALKLSAPTEESAEIPPQK